jgi:putative FmdB family regulatory protein
MPGYKYVCRSCGWDTVEVRSIEHRDDFPECGVCGTSDDIVRPIEAPGIMFTALVDGQRRSDSAYQKLKEKTVLESIRADTPVNKRGDLDREIKKLS